MSEELKPCPFCGSTNVCVFRKPWYQRWYATCNDCCGMTDDFKTNEDAINAWNHRPSPWHTGEPTEEGWYVIAFIGANKRIEYASAVWCYNEWDAHCRILAWQKIEPYNPEANYRQITGKLQASEVVE